jgi:cellulose biosynthesis protein BcsQ
MRIAVIAKKGGVGKTTLCILLHEALRQTGQQVAVRDFDAQGSATKALSEAGGLFWTDWSSRSLNAYWVLSQLPLCSP